VRRRILITAVAISALAVMVFAIPLAIAVGQQYRDQATLRLERTTIEAARTIGPGAINGSDPAELPTLAEVRLALYRPDRSLITGQGPSVGDDVVVAATTNRVADQRAAGSLVVAVPLVADEAVIGVLRGEQSSSAVDVRTHRAWLVMGGLGLVAVTIAGVVAVWLSRRLSRPLDRVRDAAVRLGDGDFTIAVPESGIVELDQVASALTVTAGRLGGQIERERSFSADVSHQLRTPLTGLRLLLETDLVAPRSDHEATIRQALGAVDRLQLTIEDLLTLARSEPIARPPLDVVELLGDVERRWQARLAGRGRPLRLELSEHLPRPSVSRAAVDNIVDVLVDNALQHGQGQITIAVEPLNGGISIAVEDEGSGMDGVGDDVFLRSAASSPATNGGHRIGLALARALADAEGGKLQLARAGRHPRFELILLTDATSVG
jgi:signal transduction histidine kinase